MTKLEASGTTVPMTYMGTDGKQYVVVAAGGTNRFGMIAATAGHYADSLVAFALSDKPRNESAVSGSQLATSASPQTQAVPKAASPVQAASNTIDVAAALPDGDGKTVVAATCTKCHGTSNFTSIRMNRAGWEDEVKSMRDRGAVGTEDDFKKIIDYLVKNFPRQ